MKFESLGIREKIASILQKKGIKEATDVQEEVIPCIFKGKDLIVKSPTGSGKTFAFLLPIIEKILKGDKGLVLILVPTRELVLQIEENLNLIANDREINYKTVYGGREVSNNIELFKEVDLIIATPGRLLEYFKKGFLNFKELKTLVIDEADLMIELGFKGEIEEIVKNLPKKRESYLFSATLSSEIKKIAYRYTKEPKVVEIDKESREIIKEKFVRTTDRRKIDILCQMLNEDTPFLGVIFCRTKARVDRLEELLIERGYSCEKLHSDIPQRKREKILENFKNLEVQFLIATDILARGIHVTGITHIYNYDAPESYETYVHRVGRTGRNGLEGESFLILTDKDEAFYKEIEKEPLVQLEEREVVYERDVKSTQVLPKNKYKKKVSISSKKIEEIQIIKERARLKKDRD